MLLVVSYHLLRKGSRESCHFWLIGLQLWANVLFREINKVAVPSALLSAPTIPSDLRTALAAFDLGLHTTNYVCCTRCKFLYKPAGGTFPDECDAPVFGSPGTVCGEPLGKRITIGPANKRLSTKRPFACFEYRSVKDFIAQLLCRPGMEEVMDSAGKARVEDISRDIWNSKVLRSFRWHDGKKSTDGPKGEGRYVFSMAIDWFNAHRSLTAKKKTSVGAIYLVCQNLPLSIRFNEENICLVGLIPGPDKPNITQLANFLNIIVDDFLNMWKEEVWYSRTPGFPLGRPVRAALGPVICDVDAARAVGGFTPHSHTRFCSYCMLKTREISNFNVATWPKRTQDPQKHREHAQLWLNAPSVKERKKIAKEYGVNYSPLLRLPYWNPQRDLVLDVMHNCFLGVLRDHCRAIWGMDFEVEGGDGLAADGHQMPSAEDLARLRTVISENPKNLESRLNHTYNYLLEAICDECNLDDIEGKDGKPLKKNMVLAIVQWVSLSRLLRSSC